MFITTAWANNLHINSWYEISGTKYQVCIAYSRLTGPTLRVAPPIPSKQGTYILRRDRRWPILQGWQGGSGKTATFSLLSFSICNSSRSSAFCIISPPRFLKDVQLLLTSQFEHKFEQKHYINLASQIHRQRRQLACCW